MRQPVNPRTQRAIDAVMKTTIDLLGHYPASEISFALISEKSGVSLPTLYKYYSDPSSLIAECAVNFISNALEKSEDGLVEENSIDYLTELMRRFVAQVYEKRVFCKHAMYGPSSSIIITGSIELIDERMRTRIVGKRLSPSGVMGDDYRGALAAGVVWLLGQWLKSDFKGEDSPEKFADRLANTLYQFSNISE